jgi:hypothetical protein
MKYFLLLLTISNVNPLPQQPHPHNHIIFIDKLQITVNPHLYKFISLHTQSNPTANTEKRDVGSFNIIIIISTLCILMIVVEMVIHDEVVRRPFDELGRRRAQGE